MQAVTITQITPPELEAIIENVLRKTFPVYQKTEVSNVGESIFTIQEAAEFLNLSKYTLYGLVAKSSIPNMKRGKRLYFSKEELTKWLKESRRQTASDAAKDADNYLGKVKKRG